MEPGHPALVRLLSRIANITTFSEQLESYPARRPLHIPHAFRTETKEPPKGEKTHISLITLCASKKWSKSGHSTSPKKTLAPKQNLQTLPNLPLTCPHDKGKVSRKSNAAGAHTSQWLAVIVLKSSVKSSQPLRLEQNGLCNMPTLRER